MITCRCMCLYVCAIACQVREASVDFDTDDEALLKKDGPAIDRSDIHHAATAIDMTDAFQIEQDVRNSFSLF